MIGGASRAVIARQQKAIRKQIDAHHRKEAKDKLAALRDAIRENKERKKAALREAVVFCRLERIRARTNAKERRIRALEELRQARAAEIVAARSACDVHKHEIKKTAVSKHHQAKEAIKAERAYQAELRRIEGRHKERHAKHRALEQRQESDDAVERDLSHETIPLWRKIKRSIRGNDRMSRSEAFWHYAEEHPHEVLQAQMELAEREMITLLRAEKKLAKTVGRRAAPTADELAAIPF